MNDIVYAGKHSLTVSVYRHFHHSWEFIYCTGGQGELVFDEIRIPYQKGDLIVIPPNTNHTNLSTGGFTNVFVNIADCTLSFHSPVRIPDDSREFLGSAMNAAYCHFSEAVPGKEALLSAYGNLLASYAASYRNSSNCSEVVQLIENAIIQNFTDCNFELDEYLRSLPFNYDYLRKLFKKELGMTPHKYLCDKRLATAANWLENVYNENTNITEISHLCGFREPLYFSRMFKKRYGVAPSYYQEISRSAAPGEVLDDNSVKIRPDESLSPDA